MPCAARAVSVALAALALLASGATAAASTVTVYFTRGEQLAPVRRTVPPGEPPGRFALRELLRGPSVLEQRVNVRTLIPSGTTLAGVSIAAGTARVTLSPRFTEGASTDAILARLTQVVQTTKGLPGVRRVDVGVEGAGGVVPVSGGAFGPGDLGPEGANPPKPVAPDRPVAGAGGGVTEVQRRLSELGYLPPEAVTGRSDYRTGQAVTAFQAWQGIGRDGVVGPQTLRALRTAGRPRPRSPAGRRVEVYRDRGVALLVDGGSLVRAVHVSTGKPGYATPAGTFSISRKALRDWSTPFQVWLPYASYFTGGIAFHEYPDVPADPASHGCVRVSAPEAPFVYRFARLGTTVEVY